MLEVVLRHFADVGRYPPQPVGDLAALLSRLRGRGLVLGVATMDDTAIVAPYMASSARDCEDPITPPQIDFSCTGDSWRAGASALSHPQLTSFDFVDEILRKASAYFAAAELDRPFKK